MSKHTQGPLTVRRDERSGDVAIIQDEHNIVAECFAAIRRPYERSSAEAMANAKLYAAAPQLLEALEYVRSYRGEVPTHIADVCDIAITAAKGNA